MEALDIHVQGVLQLRSGCRDQDHAIDRPLTLHFILSVARGPEVSKVRSITELCRLRVSVESYVAPKDPLQCKRCQRFGHTQRNCGYAPRWSLVLAPTTPVGAQPPGEQPQCCGCGGNHTASYRGCVKWKEAKAAFEKRSPEVVRKSAAQSAAHKAQRTGPSAEQTDLGDGWNHVARGERFVKATTTPPNPKLDRSQRRPRSLKWPTPEKRLCLRSPSQNLQHPLSRPLRSQRRKPRV
jgi:hypothetical protein